MRGTGFGLSIVQAVVDAHTWDVRVTESQAGGARFDIRTASTDWFAQSATDAIPATDTIPATDANPATDADPASDTEATGDR